MSIKYIIKRDGTKVPFDSKKIKDAVMNAARSVELDDETIGEEVTQEVLSYLKIFYKDEESGVPDVEQIQDLVEKVLIEKGYAEVAKSYILYREQHKKIRDTQALFNDALEAMDDYLQLDDWKVNENSNMGYSLQGLNNFISSEVTAQYWLQEIYSEEVREKHNNGDFHVHDLGNLSVYCCGWDLQDLLQTGFRGVSTKIESEPPKHLKTALGQIVNFFFTLQGEAAGAMAFSNFDTYLAPFIAYDNLDYEEVKQAMQEFLFNMNVPTRVGFQCLSEDTEILTPEGWKKYDEVAKGDVIKTYNVEEKHIENKKVKKVFSRHYEGKMYNAKNRIQDQLLSPGHRMVRKKFNTDNYCLEEVEAVRELKSPPIVPIAADNNNPAIDLTEEEIKLIAWIIAEGSLEINGSWRRITIYQSQKKNRATYEEIISLLKVLDIDYSIHEGSESLGSKVSQIRFNAEQSRNILEYFDQDDNVKKIPEQMLEMSQHQSRVFLETFIKGDGHEGCKITTSDPQITEDLQQVIVNSGYGFTVWQRPATGVGNKLLSIIRVIRHQDTYIQEIDEIDYEGVIWSVNTDNETVIAKRKEKVFITGNTPFTNITMDLNVPEFLKDQPVIVGGESKERTYGEFEKEMDMFNRAFAELMQEGDAKGRVFSFPIPTYNITSDFEWNNELLDPLWEMTAKYGIPYFSNFVNSDMNPEDARSMCCRLRIDNRELRKRGGGLFGANPMTGSVGVVTINLARIGHLARDENDFMERIYELMDLAKGSLEVKRRVLENLTDQGLYPYARFYLRDVKKRFDEYWKNHFNTIGINGMNEALINFMGKNIASPEGRSFALQVMDLMRERMVDYQEETENLYNLEATPAEGTTYRLAKMDKERFGSSITVANEDKVKSSGAEPYYTNSTHLPVGYTDDIFTALDLQDELQQKYTGGTVLHGFLGERMPDIEGTKKLIKRIAENYSLPYYTLTPTFSICPEHGYLAGEHEYCPKCAAEE